MLADEKLLACDCLVGEFPAAVNVAFEAPTAMLAAAMPKASAAVVAFSVGVVEVGSVPLIRAGVAKVDACGIDEKFFCVGWVELIDSVANGRRDVRSKLYVTFGSLFWVLSCFGQSAAPSRSRDWGGLRDLFGFQPPSRVPAMSQTV